MVPCHAQIHRRSAVAALAVYFAACGGPASSPASSPAGSIDDRGAAGPGGATDATIAPDGGATPDAGTADAATPDAGTPDAGTADAGETCPRGEQSCAVADAGSPVTFGFIEQNVIQGENCTNCHGQSAGPGVGNLDLVTHPYGALVGVPAINRYGSVHEQADGGPLLRVSPGDPSESLFYIKLGLSTASSQWGQPMPMSSPHSTPPSLMNAVQTWIAAGAPND